MFKQIHIFSWNEIKGLYYKAYFEFSFTKWMKTPQSGNNNYFELKDNSINWWPFGYMIPCKFTLECIRKMPGQNQDYKPWFGTHSELLYSTEKY